MTNMIFLCQASDFLPDLLYSSVISIIAHCVLVILLLLLLKVRSCLRAFELVVYLDIHDLLSYFNWISL